MPGDTQVESEVRDAVEAQQHHELLQYWGAMVRACRPLLDSLQDAEDCASEALLAALSQPDELTKGVRNQEAWLVAVAKRRAVDRLRQVGRGRTRLVKMAVRTDSIDWREPGDAILDRLEVEWLTELARKQLPETTRAVLQGLSEGAKPAQVAHDLGLTCRSVESHLRRARLVLRAAVSATLSVLGWLFGGTRRAAVGSSVAVVSIALVLLPGAKDMPMQAAPPAAESMAIDGSAPERKSGVVPDGRTPPAASRVEAPPNNAFRKVAPVQRQRPLARRSGATEGAVVKDLRVVTPAGRTTVEQEDRSAATEPLDIAADCLRNVKLNLARVGC